jgi:hypothetical protein
MGKVFIGFILLISVSASQTFAQSAHVTATVNFHLSGTVSLTKVRDLDMGFVIQGVGSTTIDPISGDGKTAYFIFVGEPNSPVFVSFSSSDLTDGPIKIAFTSLLAGNSSSSQEDATLLTEGRQVVTSEEGAYYFWGGGTTTLSPTQPFGVYIGSFILSIAY